MTQWSEQSLRQQGQPWPGLNGRGGRLDDGSGWLEDGSINAQINRADVLEKRKGMVRGIEEWFGGVVCGLFTYQDYCGNQYLLIADEEGINIRQLFQLPQFTASDAYPNDDFEATLSEDDWRNTSRYRTSGGVLIQVSGAAAFTGSRLGDSLFMRWFKMAGGSAYEVRVDYTFDSALAQEQRIGVVIKGNDDLSAGALLQAEVVYKPGSVHRLDLYHRDAGLTVTKLATQDLNGNPSGTMTLSYERDLSSSSYIPKVQITPDGGTPRSVSGASLTTLQDADLGQVSALAVAQDGGLSSVSCGIELVTGGPI